MEDLAAQLAAIRLRSVSPAEVILAPAALTDAHAVILASGDSPQARDARLVVAGLHMARARQMADVEAAAERRIAATLWAMDAPAADRAVEAAMELVSESERARLEYDVTRSAERLAVSCERAELALFLAGKQLDEHLLTMVCHVVLATALMRVYERSGDKPTIVAAVAAMRSAAATWVDADVPASDFETLFGAVLVRLYECDRDLEVLDEAIEHMRRGLAGRTSGLSLSTERSNLSVALLRRHTHTGEESDLEQALDLARAAVVHSCIDDPERAQWLHNLVEVLTAACRRTGARSLFQEMQRAAADALAAAPAGHALHWTCAGDLASTYALDHDLFGNAAALADAIALMADVVNTFPDGHLAKPVFTTRYARLLLSDYRRTGDITQLNAAEALLRQALTAGDVADPVVRGNLATLLRLRAEHTGEVSALEEGLRQARQALSDTHTHSTHRPLALLHTAGLLTAHARRTSATESLDEAIGLLREAVRAIPSGSEVSGVATANLADALRSRYEWTSERTLLDEAVQLARDALLATPLGHPELPVVLVQVGNCLLRWVQVLSNEDGLELAMELLGQRLPLLSQSHPARAHLLALLSNAHLRRYVTTGEEAAINAAVELGRRAAGQARSLEAHAVAGSSLAAALDCYYRRTGDLDALREGVTILAAAAKALPAGHENQVAILVTRASLLLSAHTHTGYPSLLREARAAAEAAVDNAPPGHFHRVTALTVLLTVERNDFLGTTDFTTLRRAGDLCQQILRDPPVAEIADIFIHMAIMNQVAYEHTQIPDVLALALDMGRSAVTYTDDAHPNRALALLQLANILQSGGQLRDASETAREAADHPAATVLDRVLAATLWGDLALKADLPESAVQGFETAVNLLPRLAPRSLSRADRETGLGIHTGLGSNAAAAALALGHTGRAAALLEQARGILLTEGITDRTWLDALRDHDSGLAEEATRLWARMAAVETDDARPRGTGPERLSTTRRLAADRAQLARDWDELLHRVQVIPGLVPSLEPSVPTVPSGCTVVIVNVAETRSDAIIITAGLPPHHIPLPELSYTEAQAHASLRPSDAGLNRTLDWLWRAAVKRILDELGHTEPAGLDAPRVWWCPTGPLTGLPLHAAGQALDRVVSSYLPTARSLSYSRGRPRAEFGVPCVVSMPETPGADALPGVYEEIRHIRTRFPDAVVLDEDATHARVLETLPHHPVAYFACHALAKAKTPGASTLLLRDHETKPFTVMTVSRLQLRNAELAFLSACGTAETKPALADGGINIAEAFQLAGYRHVIGTLWPIADDVAPAVARAFLAGFDDARPNADRAPYALRAASLASRAEQKDRSTAWAGHIHVGA
jgi:tetratricopeptide (TPR) repeat protein